MTTARGVNPGLPKKRRNQRVEAFLELAGIFRIVLLIPFIQAIASVILEFAIGQHPGGWIYCVVTLGYSFAVVPLFANSLYHRSIKQRIDTLRQKVPDPAAQLLGGVATAQIDHCRYNATVKHREVDRIMARMVWFYSIPIVVFFVLGALAVGAVRRGRGPVRCSSCVTPMSARRRSLFRLPFGGWVCPHCGTQIGPREVVNGRSTTAM